MKQKIHFIGCEGVSMKTLMAICSSYGFEVTGSDIRRGDHSEGNLADADIAVYSAAIPRDNVELVLARQSGITVLSRAQLLGRICAAHDFSIAIAGTHGKTTTTAMLWEILAPLDPTVHIGGNYKGRAGSIGNSRNTGVGNTGRIEKIESIEGIEGSIESFGASNKSGAVNLGESNNSRARDIGGGGLFITEACEYQRSFLSLFADVGIVLNTDLDHTDCYKTADELRAAYLEFAKNARRLAIVGGEERELLSALRGPRTTYNSNNSNSNDSGAGAANPINNTGAVNPLNNTGANFKSEVEAVNPINNIGAVNSPNNSGVNFKSEIGAANLPIGRTAYPHADMGVVGSLNDIGADVAAGEKRVMAVGLTADCDLYADGLAVDKNGRYSFCVFESGRRLGRISLGVAGRHNVTNALFAVAASLFAGVSFDQIAAGLGRFVGAERRMQLVGRRGGCAVFSDYAHHPDEIATTILSARECGFERVTAVFEPHTYSRTASFLDGFVRALSAADRVVLLPIFAARELPIEGVDSRLILNGLLERGVSATYCDSYQTANEQLLCGLEDSTPCKQNSVSDGEKDLKSGKSRENLDETNHVILFMGAGSIDTLAHSFVD